MHEIPPVQIGLTVMALALSAVACYTGYRQGKMSVRAGTLAEIEAVHAAHFQFLEDELGSAKARLLEVEQQLALALQHVERCEQTLAGLRKHTHCEEGINTSDS
jgi:hypothetical protein